MADKKLKSSQSTPKTKKPRTVRKNQNGKPVLNGNSLKQAQKPSKAPVSLPTASGILPDLEEYEITKKELASQKDQYFLLEKQHAALASKLHDANLKILRQSRALARFGVGSAE